ncbi:MAG: EAL domain-containing protein [Lachnospiraceae bacterium]|nr:EAL domain-containing protein [Lachnospiraceae bacterium]
MLSLIVERIGSEKIGNYITAGDITVIIICILIIILFMGTFVEKNCQFKIFELMIAFLLVGTCFHLLYHYLISIDYAIEFKGLIILREFSQLYYLMIFYLYILYLLELATVEGRERKTILIVSAVYVVLFVTVDILGSVFKYGFHIDENGDIVSGFDSFNLAYFFLIMIIFYVLVHYRRRMIPQIVRAIFAVFIMCLIILIIQEIMRNSSFTSVVFLLPATGIMYMLHSNPFDMSTGAINEESFGAAVRECFRRKDRFILIYLDMLDVDLKTIPARMRFAVYQFYRGKVNNALLFKAGQSKVVLMFKEKNNSKYWSRVDALKDEFKALYKEFKMDFKIVYMEDDESLNENIDYIRFFSYTEKKVGLNSFYKADYRDIKEYNDSKKILGELEDIVSGRDLDDERVLVYCQPVYNVGNGLYDTAEALMRLKLDEFGIVPPYKFIPLAEKYNLIHGLSLVILNKTCKNIKAFMDEGLNLKRISVNFSIQEMKLDSFCEDVIGIIKSNDIPYDMIAIEITESRTESDFETVKKKIEELKDYGIKFYLDDFGTGYSNFERIMELPFDIIKFDMSMVSGSRKSTTSAYMVNTFSEMFRKLSYNVLYEGIEDDDDEKRCINMSAHYLQGYKYSKPIDITELSDFLVKRA